MNKQFLRRLSVDRTVAALTALTAAIRRVNRPTYRVGIPPPALIVNVWRNGNDRQTVPIEVGLGHLQFVVVGEKWKVVDILRNEGTTDYSFVRDDNFVCRARIDERQHDGREFLDDEAELPMEVHVVKDDVPKKFLVAMESRFKKHRMEPLPIEQDTQDKFSQFELNNSEFRCVGHLMERISENKGNVLRCPTGGRVVDVSKSVGDRVTKGEAIFSLEVMKLESIIRSPTDGKISKIIIKFGDMVSAGDVAIEFAED